MRKSYVWKSSAGGGWMGAVVDEERTIRLLLLPRPSPLSVRAELLAAGEEKPVAAPPPLLGAALERYFREGVFACTLEADPAFGTPFQRRVWRETALIPSGGTRTYGWLAAKVGSPKAARAVGQAMGANPLPIIVP